MSTITHDSIDTQCLNDLKNSKLLRMFITQPVPEHSEQVIKTKANLGISDYLDYMVLFDNYSIFLQTETNNIYELIKPKKSTDVINIEIISVNNVNAKILPQEIDNIGLELLLVNNTGLWERSPGSVSSKVSLIEATELKLDKVHSLPVHPTNGAENYHEFMIEDTTPTGVTINLNGDIHTFEYIDTTPEILEVLKQVIEDGKEYMDDCDINCFTVGESIWFLYDQEADRFAIDID